jgi:hypothetical protein
MQSLLQGISPEMTADHVADIMTELDVHQKGEVVFEDFYCWCSSHIHVWHNRSIIIILILILIFMFVNPKIFFFLQYNSI